MATTPAAYSASNVYNDLIVILDRMAADTPVLFPQFCKVRTDVAKQIRSNSRNPLSFASAFSGSAPTAQQVKVSNHSMTVAESLFATDVLVPWRDEKLNEDEVARAMVDLVDVTMRHYDSLATAALEAALAGTLTVADGNGSTVGFFALSSGHTLQGGGGQTNKVATALSASSLAAARAIIHSWTDNVGNPLNLVGVPLALVVPSELTDLAMAITSPGAASYYANTPIGGTAGMANVGNNPLGNIRVVENPYLSDANDWFLIPMGERSPFTCWFEAPEFTAFPDQRDRGVYLGVTYNAKVYAEPPTFTTAVGASVT